MRRSVRLLLCACAASILAACGGGGGGGGTTPPPPPVTDTSPDPFSFPARTGVAVSTNVDSDPVTVAGINAAAAISVTGGQYSIAGGAFTATAGTVNNGQTVVVRVASSAQASTAASATLTIGGVSATFTATTAAPVSGGGPPQPLGSQNWSMFGHDYSNTRASADVTIGATNIPNLHVVKRVTGSGVASTPAVVDGVVYYGDFGGHLKAVDASTGTVIWDTPVQTSAGIGGGLPPMLTPSPFVSGDTIYTGGNAGWIYAVNRATGAVKWSTKIESTPNSRVSSSPVVVGNTVIVGSGSYQVFIPGTPVFRGKVVFLNATTGAILNYNVDVCPVGTCGGGISVWSSAAVDTATRTAYIGTGQAYIAPAGPYSDSLMAFDIDTGVIKWNYQFTPNDVYTINTGTIDHDVGAAPNLFTATVNGVVRQLVGVGDKGGRYAAFDRVTGEQIWIKTLGPGSPIGGMMHSAAYSNGKIYTVNNTAIVGGTRNDPVPSSSTVRALDAATGNDVWTNPQTLSLPAGGFGGVSIANGFMYFTTWDGQLRVVDTANGTLLKSVQLGNAVGAYIAAPTDGFPDGSASGPVVSNGRIYVGFGWTWVASINGGLSILESDATIPAQSWTATCPNNYDPVPGVNTGFPTPTNGPRAFSLNLPADLSKPRPVWVPLTGTVESTNENLDSRGGNRKLTDNGYIVIGPVRQCALQDPSGAGSTVGTGGGGACNAAGAGGWTWNPWNEGRIYGGAGDQWKTNEGPDSLFLEAVVKCVAAKYNVDHTRVYVGGISSGGTMTNRALTFRSDFWAGGMPISGEWYVSKDDGSSYNPGGDDFIARSAAVAADPTKIFQGRVGPFPLKTTLEPMVVLTVWGGATDNYRCDGVNLCSDYRPTTQVGSNYFSSMSNVVHIACSTTDGHQWPSINRDAFNLWALTTLSSHPKGTPRDAFILTTPPAGYTCKLGAYTDHY